MNRLELNIRVYDIDSEELARGIYCILENMWKFKEADFLPDQCLLEAWGVWTTKLSDEAIVDRMTRAVWGKAEYSCKIEVDIIHLDENPTFFFDRGRADYDRVMVLSESEE